MKTGWMSLLAGVLLLAGTGVRADEIVSVLRDGERIAYALYLQEGFVAVPAGSAELSTVRTNDLYDLELKLAASPVVDKVYHLSARLASRVASDLRPHRYTKHAEEGGRVYDEVMDFLSAPAGGCTVSCRRTEADGRFRTNTVHCATAVYDLVSVLFQARTADFAARARSGRMKLPVATGIRVEDQELVSLGEEAVERADGRDVRCQVFSLLKRTKDGRGGGERARFWLSTDDRRLPVRINLSLKFGAASARLLE